MRILMACAAFPPFIDGGGPISAMMVAKLLLADGHDLEVVNVSGEDKREIYDGVPVRRLLLPGRGQRPDNALRRVGYGSAAISLCSVSSVDASATPSTCACRKCRWNAPTTFSVRRSKSPVTSMSYP